MVVGDIVYLKDNNHTFINIIPGSRYTIKQIYTNSKTSTLMFDESPGYFYISEYFITLKELRQSKLKTLEDV